jgi:hypothetical protein
MNKSFETRLAALEQRPDPALSHIVLLFGEECDAFDAAYAAGDYDAAAAVLVRSNPSVPEWVLREYYLHASEFDISPGAVNGVLIRAEYGDVERPT